MNDILRIGRLKIALQRAFLGRAILRVIGFRNPNRVKPGEDEEETEVCTMSRKRRCIRNAHSYSQSQFGIIC